MLPVADNKVDERPKPTLNPKALSLGDAAKILTASGPKPVTAAMIQADVDAGAPVNADGTLNLVHFAAWLVKETVHGSD